MRELRSWDGAASERRHRRREQYRALVSTVRCPLCGAVVDQGCVNPLNRAPRLSVHRERIEHFTQLNSGVLERRDGRGCDTGVR